MRTSQVINGILEELAKGGHEEADIAVIDQYGAEATITDIEVMNGVVFVVIDTDVIRSTEEPTNAG
jgi:hypothetical protein